MRSVWSVMTLVCFNQISGVYSVGGSLSIVNWMTLQLVQVRLAFNVSTFDFVALLTRIYREVVTFGHSALLSSLSRIPRLYKPTTRAKEVFT